METRTLKLKDGDKLVPIDFDVITIKETGAYTVSGDHFLKLEELEQLKEDSAKLKELESKNCSNCKDTALNRDDRKMCLVQLEIAAATHFRKDLSEISCSLHERVSTDG